MSSDDVKRVIAEWKRCQSDLLKIPEGMLDGGDSPQLPFLVADFVKTWGVEDAVGIVQQAFKFPHNGMSNGAWLGERLFSTREMRQFQSQLRQEYVMAKSSGYLDNHF